MRLRPGRDGRAFSARLDDPLLVTDTFVPLDKTVDDVQVLLTAMLGLTEHPVLTWRPATGVGCLTVGSRAEIFESEAYHRIVHRWLRHVLGVDDSGTVRVGLLGFGAIGTEHVDAVDAVDGLALTAVADRNPDRVAAALELSPDVAAYADADALLADTDVDLVVVSTPPNAHAAWVTAAFAAGKHVVVEKPFAVTTAEADQMAEAARQAGRLLAVYQNRRWDADFLALERVVRGGGIGDVFHYESFVGSYGHPCNYWHSDEEVSGGAIYDWGSHFLFWMLDLLGTDITHVTAAAHKRVWHDVTNADHSRVTVRFASGAEGEFTHSDLAAAAKPKWYVLGTRGAIVGHYGQQLTEAHATLAMHTPDGAVTQLRVPAAPPHAFHRELADRLLTGAPMSVSLDTSRCTVAVMEAAATSAREGGRPVVPG
jgi:predicted dehydrogenase